MRLPGWLSGGGAKEPPVAVGDPRFDGWETVNTFEDQATAGATSYAAWGWTQAASPIILWTRAVAATSTWWSLQTNGRARTRSSRISTER
jgi:hypothetical protein